jgi:GNAT superfamily N-acetyltransferase
MKYTISIEDNPSQPDLNAVEAGLVGYNDSQAEKENWRPIAVLMRDENGEIVAGVDGHTHWNWLAISHLWVSEGLRGQGYGRKLMFMVEQEAVKRGCTHAHLDTFDFQAKPFYEKLGYEVFGTLEDFPPGHANYYMQKRLEAREGIQ